MKMRKNGKLIGGLSAAAFLSLATSGWCYTIPTSYTWDATVPNYNAVSTVHAGTIDTSLWVTADFLGVNQTTPTVGFGDSGVSVGWDDAWVGNVGHGNTNGDNLDGLWVQILSAGGWWDLGTQASSVAVFTSQDHGPYLGEGLEYRVFATNTLWDDTSLSAQASMTDVYLDGWRTHNPNEDANGNGNGWLSDDISAVFNLGASYQYVKLVAWGGGSYTEPEIDAVAAPIPEPATMLLFGTGLAGLAGLRRKKK